MRATGAISSEVGAVSLSLTDGAGGARDPAVHQSIAGRSVQLLQL